MFIPLIFTLRSPAQSTWNAHTPGSIIQVYLTALMYFSCNVSYSSLPVFLPQILIEFGPQFASHITAQGLSAPPYFLAFVLVILTTHIADRTAQRGITIMVMSAIGAIGYILLATTESAGPRYTGVYFAAAGIFSCVGNILPWTLNNQGLCTPPRCLCSPR